MTPDLTLLLPLITLALAAMGLLMLGVFTKRADVTAVLAAATLAGVAYYTLHTPAMGAVAMGGGATGLQFSPFTHVAQVVLLVLGAVAMGLMPVMTPHRPEMYVMMMLSIVGMGVLMAATDFLSFYVGLELMSFPLYIMAAWQRENVKSSEAALKYFVLGGLVSGLFLFGVSLVYAATGGLTFGTLAQAVGQGASPLLLVGCALVGISLVFKLSLVPFHMWTPDVYEGAPTPVVAFMGALPKLAASVALIRLLQGPMAGLVHLWQPALAGLAVASMVVGSSIAIMQSNLKRLLAWSTIANVGFIMVGVVAFNAMGNGAVLFYGAVYGLTSLGLFAAVAVLEHNGRTEVADIAGLGRTHPVLATALAVLLFSLAGVPPLAGFMAKLGVFSAAVEAGQMGVAIAGVLASVIAVFYSLWLIKVMVFDSPADNARPIHSALLPVVVIGLSVAVAVLLGIFPDVLGTLTLPAGGVVF